MRCRSFAAGTASAVTLIGLVVGVPAPPASAATAGVASVSSAAPAAAAAAATYPGHDKVVSEVPAFMPKVLDGAVWAFAELGNKMVVGGDFTQVSSRGSDVALSRPNIFVFDKSTGQVSTTVVPTLNGKVETLQPGPLPNTVFAAGAFTRLNGAGASHLALIDITTGNAVPGFKAAATDGKVNDLRLVGNRLYAGGFFTTVGGLAHNGLATYDATTGKVDPFMGVQLAEHHNNTGTGAQGAIGAKSLDITPDGSQLVVIGNFRTANLLPRDQVVLISLSGASAAVRSDWRTRRYEPYCSKGAFDSYMRGVDVSPDGSFFVIATTGGPNAGTLCDTASRWETNATGDAVEPTWVNDTGGDTLWSVEITEQAAYIGGHNRWLNNPSGRDNAGAGAVPRPGIAALDTRTGIPLDWNAGRNPRGVSAYELYATPTGLWVGHDTDYFGNFQYNRGKMGFFPLDDGYRLAGDRAPVLPGTAYLGAAQVATSARVLYRINAGGSLVASQTALPDWAADPSTSSLHSGGTTSATYPPSVTLSPSVPAGTPTALFDSERSDDRSNGPDMDWMLPVTAGTPLEVHLFFANRCTCSSTVGARRFNVSIDNVTKLSNYDIVADVGNNVGTMKSFPITSDGTVNINFDQVTTNNLPLVNAIEVVRTDVPDVPPTPPDEVPAVGFDGTAATPLPVNQWPASGGIAWRNARGAFWLDGTLYNGWADGTMTARSFDGTTFGSPRVLNPWADPVWLGQSTGSGGVYDGKASGFAAELPNVTGMFYLDGRLYYTLNGTSTLFWRWFSPDSGIVGAVRFSAPAGFNFANIRGMFYSGNAIYAALSTNGQLVRIGFTGGTPAATGTNVGSGVDWRSRALFMVGAPANQPPSASFTTHCTDQSCGFDATGSADADGSIASYAWDFGDGGTGGGLSPTHDYLTPGSYVVTLTVTDDDGDTASTTRTVQAAAPNVAPDAAYTIDCAGLLCAFDGRGSTDSDGAVASYAWSFGGDGQATGAQPAHRFSAAGTYDVTLTVTDDDGAQDDVTQQVVVAQAADGIAFVGRDMATSFEAGVHVTIPAAAQVGDTALLLVTHNVEDPGFTAPTGVSGWTQEESRVTVGMTTTLWSKVLTASDAGSVVTVTANRAVRATMTAAVWSGANPADPVAAASSSVDAATAVHTTPQRQATHGQWVVSYWSDKSSATTAWVAPDSVQVRGSSIGTGSGRVTSLLADSGAAVPNGPVGGLTATTDAASTRGINMTITLAPTPPKQAPTAAFDRTCTNLSCAFDAVDSSDPDGTIDSYDWDFGDQQTGAGISPQHAYQTPGSYQVTLTVTDNDGETATASQTFVVQAAHIEAVAANKATGNAASVTVQVPADAAAGDTAVLFATHSAIDPNITALTGWTLEDTRTSGSATSGMVTTVWSRTLTAADAGTGVTVTANRALKTTLSLAVYRGALTTDSGVQVTSAAEASTTAHTTPTVTTSEPTWVLSYFADKSSSTTAWTRPPATQTRAEAYTTLAGRVTSLLVDRNDATPAGQVGGLSASTDFASSRAVVMTVVLAIAP